jgi:Tfp pilus assembly protein PilP
MAVAVPLLQQCAALSVPASGAGYRMPRLAIFALLALLLTGCEDAPKPPPPEPPPPPGTAAAAAAAAGSKVDLANWIVLGENTKYKPIKDLHLTYALRPIEGLSNPWLNNLSIDVVKPVPAKKDEPIAGTDMAAEVETPLTEETCATRYPIDRYQLVLISSGHSQPKAVMIGPAGEQCVLVRGDAIGTEQGRVRAILQYEVRITIEGQIEPKVLTIAPPISAGESQEEEEDSD